MATPEYCVVIHGGAGVISEDIDGSPYYKSLENILQSLHLYIKEPRTKDITAVDICEYAVRMLEDNPLFNAGQGAVMTNQHCHELEASIMDGSNLKCGAVSMIKRIKNPISVARLVMDTTAHNYILGEAAEALAERAGHVVVDNSYFTTEKRRLQLLTAIESQIVARDHDLPTSGSEIVNTTSNVDREEEKEGGGAALQKGSNGDKMGTVGAVCMYRGSVAAATSTGGMTNKMSGRVGDSPLIGAGTYASNDSCAVSATGWGEEFMRRVAAYDIAARMKYGGHSLATACRSSVMEYLPLDSGGVIAVDSRGNFSMDFNSSGMFRGMICDDGSCEGRVGIWSELKSFPLA